MEGHKLNKESQVKQGQQIYVVNGPLADLRNYAVPCKLIAVLFTVDKLQLKSLPSSQMGVEREEDARVGIGASKEKGAACRETVD